MIPLVCSITTVLALSVSGFGANITVFDTRAGFLAGTSSVNTNNFEGIVAATAAVNFVNPAGLTTSGVNFFTSGGGQFGSGPVTVYGATLAGMQSPVINTGTGAVLVWGPPNQPGNAFLNAVLPAGITAVGTDFWAQQPFITAVDVTVNASDATSQTVTVNTVNRPTASFIGFTSDVAITSLLFRTPAGQTGVVVDNFSIGQALSVPIPPPQVPEPITALLLGTGLVGIAAVKKRTRVG
jgi:hypothetical protein